MESVLYAITGGTLGMLLVVFGQTLDLKKRLRQLSRIDAKLDMLLKQAELEFNPLEHVKQDVIDAIRRGDKIEAIRLYRETNDVGLKDAKEYVEELQRRAGLGG